MSHHAKTYFPIFIFPCLKNKSAKNTSYLFDLTKKIMMCIQFLLVSKRIGSIDTLLLQMMDHFLLQKYFYATFMNVGINFGPENWRRKKRMKALLPYSIIKNLLSTTAYFLDLFLVMQRRGIVFICLGLKRFVGIGNRNCPLKN